MQKQQAFRGVLTHSDLLRGGGFELPPPD